MDNALFVGLSRQAVLQRQLDVIANNVANVDTAGFKVESLMVEPDPQSLPADPASGASSTVTFAYDAGVVRDFSQGALKQTGAPLDMAVEGAGFFKISTPAGERYTRDGRFSMDSQGRLTTASGQSVLDSGGSEITLDPTKGPPTVGGDGTISQQGQILGKVGVVNFASLSGLSKDGDGLYRNDSNLTPQAATDVRVLQGMIEGSNVEPITQITKLIEVSRAYESTAQMMSQTQDLETNSINRLGRLS